MQPGSYIGGNPVIQRLQQPVTGEVTLQPNDVVQAGQSKFSFLEGLTTMSMKIDQDLKALDRLAQPPANPPPA